NRRALEAVVGEDVRRDGRIFIRGVAVVGDVRHRVDRDVDRGGLGHSARGHGVGVAVGTVVIGVRRVGDGAVVVVDDRAVRALGDSSDDRGSLEAVVGEDVGGDGGVFVRAVAVVRG